MSLLSIALLSLTLASSVYADAANSTESPLAGSGPPPLMENKVLAVQGGNATLPCRLHRQYGMAFGNAGMRVKWTKLSDDEAVEEDVLVSMGFHKKSYGKWLGRVSLREEDDDDASLLIKDVSGDDLGKFRCEVINGIDDDVQDVMLAVEGMEAGAPMAPIDPSQGVVFPYSPRLGRYNLNFADAEKACLDVKAVVANFDQLYQAWRDGLDWCNAGWLSDGSVQYPITNPRGPCGGDKNGPGLRSYGRQHKENSRYDVFCFTPVFTGRFYWLVQPEHLSFNEAVQACLDDGAEIATVAHIYAAWRLQGYDRCDAGWLADGSVRYPISRPRKHCSPTEAAVRMVGFPDKKQKLYGVYCYKA